MNESPAQIDALLTPLLHETNDEQAGEILSHLIKNFSRYTCGSRECGAGIFKDITFIQRVNTENPNGN